MSRERSNTNDIMEALDLYKGSKMPDDDDNSPDGPVAEEPGTRKRTETDGDVASSFDEVVLDWNSLFGQENCDFEVAQLGLKGLLRGCPFRSVCWKIFLGILTEDHGTWCKQMKRHRRQYADIHAKFIADPRDQADCASDLAVDDPLSLDTESPWNKYFQDEELRATIVRDVERTFPEVDYFQEPNVQAMLTTILFCYCRLHTSLGYRQGMHELLAIFVLVLDCDKRDRSNLSLEDPWAEEMLVVLDADSVEADAYILFSALMETCGLWFDHQPVTTTDPDAGPTSTPLGKKLERIQDRLLKKEDPVLYAHFQKYSIAPQLYALRWVRLLFSREFPLLDVLVLWDAILAYSPNLDLVDYVAIAMLLIARPPLLTGTETSTVGLLLNYPHVPDVHLVVQKALFLRNPKVYPRPPNWQLEDDMSSRAPVMAPGTFKISAQLTLGARSLAEKVTSTASKLKNIPSQRIRPGHEKSDGSPLSPPRRTAANISHRIRLATNRIGHTSPEGASTASTAGPSQGTAMYTDSRSRDAAAAAAAGGHRTSNAFASEETSLSPPSRSSVDVEGTEVLRSPSVEFTKLQAACIRCSRHMNLYLRILQSDVLTLELPEECEDRVLRSVAGLKQVRDVLSGVLASDEVQFQSLEGVLLPDGISAANDELYEDVDPHLAADVDPHLAADVDPDVAASVAYAAELVDSRGKERAGEEDEDTTSTAAAFTSSGGFVEDDGANSIGSHPLQMQTGELT